MLLHVLLLHTHEYVVLILGVSVCSLTQAQ